ncbi:MAG: hypothetical protein M1819_001054 [Sarea resinae]|nr:MAG: hypothetical protein M1819_001054 [Sarea resinae]
MPDRKKIGEGPGGVMITYEKIEHHHDENMNPRPTGPGVQEKDDKTGVPPPPAAANSKDTNPECNDDGDGLHFATEDPAPPGTSTVNSTEKVNDKGEHNGKGAEHKTGVQATTKEINEESSSVGSDEDDSSDTNAAAMSSALSSALRIPVDATIGIANTAAVGVGKALDSLERAVSGDDGKPDRVGPYESPYTCAESELDPLAGCVHAGVDIAGKEKKGSQGRESVEKAKKG